MKRVMIRSRDCHKNIGVDLEVQMKSHENIKSVKNAGLSRIIKTMIFENILIISTSPQELDILTSLF